MRYRMLVTLSILLVAGCDGQRQGGDAACGIAALAGPTILLSEFGVPGQTLAATPSELPERLVARLAAGPAYRAVVGRADSTWVIGVEGTFEADGMPGFGVLVLDQSATAIGVMLFEGEPLERAPILGEVSIGNEMIPLIGIKLNRVRFEDPACPFFPDSLLL